MPRITKAQIRLLAEGEAADNKKKLLKELEEKRYISHRKKYLPTQIVAARRKLELLVEEAKRLNMKHLLSLRELNDL